MADLAITDSAAHARLMAPIRYRIFYGDGGTYDDTDGSVYDAPALNVQAVVVVHPDVGWYCARSSDYYWHDAHGWEGGDIFGLWDYLARPGPKKVIFGRSIGKAEFQAIMRRALHDDRLPQKSAYFPNERRS